MEPTQTHAPSVVVLGPSGAGKTTLGRALALRLGCSFLDADDFHSAAAIKKMAQGLALTDADRAPWLARLAAELSSGAAQGTPLVLACSALKSSYRAILRGDTQNLRFLWLDVPPAELEQRLRARQGHFAGPALISSQLAIFEPPTEGLHLDGRLPLGELLEQSIQWLTEKAGGPWSL